MTESGSPSGIATTTTVTAIIKNPTNYFQWIFESQLVIGSVVLSIVNLINKITKMKIAEYNPKYPISLAIFSSFYYNGVDSGSAAFKLALIFPIQELSPTTKIMYFPHPVNTLVPDNKIGDGTSWAPDVFLPPSEII